MGQPCRPPVNPDPVAARLWPEDTRGQHNCTRPVVRNGRCEVHSDPGELAAHREGVIEGLERALTLFPNAHAVTQWDPQDAIRDTLERLRAEQKEG